MKRSSLKERWKRDKDACKKLKENMRKAY